MVGKSWWDVESKDHNFLLGGNKIAVRVWSWGKEPDGENAAFTSWCSSRLDQPGLYRPKSGSVIEFIEFSGTWLQ